VTIAKTSNKVNYFISVLYTESLFISAVNVCARCYASAAYADIRCGSVCLCSWIYRKGRRRMQAG